MFPNLLSKACVLGSIPRSVITLLTMLKAHDILYVYLRKTKAHDKALSYLMLEENSSKEVFKSI